MINEQKKLIEDNLRLAYKVAWRFAQCEMDMEDIQGYAMVGLVKAAVVYDISRGLKFSSLAVPVIEREILNALRGYKKARREISLDAEVPGSNGQEGLTLADMIPYRDPGFDQVECIDLIPTMMSLPGLKEREKQAITGVILQGRRQEAVGEAIGIRQSVVSRYAKSGIRKIRAVYFGKEGVRK